MRLPPIELDDRRFQELVSEARTRIAQLCPEWTEHNVSDPGITLIELFAWMTEMTTYRLNRVPEKVHVELLDLLGVGLRPPTPARTEVRFVFSASPIAPVTIEARETEVGTVRTAHAESIVFEVNEGRTVAPLAPSAYVLLRGGEIKDVAVDDGIARPAGDDRATFSATPQFDDALHLGFDDAIGRLLLMVDVEAEPARGAGVDPKSPPLAWEVSVGEGEWAAATVLEDTTGGFNFGNGRVVIEAPLTESARVPFGGHRMHWLRCRVIPPTVAGGGAYQQPPNVISISAAPIGVTLPARHGAHVDNEMLGESDGTPAQSFQLLRAPMLAPSGDEFLEVRDGPGSPWERWTWVESFVDAGPADRVWSCDPSTGTIELGPSVRQHDGSWKQYGGIPAKGAQLRMSRYRHGGGLEGNVAAGALNVLKTGPTGIASVVNPLPATGGVDPEPLDAVRKRGAMELRARHRAVTKEDFEHLATEASSRVARVVCVPPEEGTGVSVRILPTVYPADRPLSYDELLPPRDLLDEVATHLDGRRLLGMSLHVAPVRLRAVSVVVELQTEPLADLMRIREETEAQLYRYLNPIVGGTPDGLGTGWEFGRTLNQGELYGVVHAVPGVEYVKLLRIYESDLRTGRQAAEPTGTHLVLEPDEVIASARHVVKTTMRGT